MPFQLLDKYHFCSLSAVKLADLALNSEDISENDSFFSHLSPAGWLGVVGKVSTLVSLFRTWWWAYLW